MITAQAYEGNDQLAPAGPARLTISRNLHRRDMLYWQRAETASNLANLKRGDSKYQRKVDLEYSGSIQLRRKPPPLSVSVSPRKTAAKQS
jgi:hypothetical protein